MEISSKLYSIAGIYVAPRIRQNVRDRLTQALNTGNLSATDQEIEKLCKARERTKQISSAWNILWDIAFAIIILFLASQFRLISNLADVVIFAVLLSLPQAIFLSTRLFSAFREDRAKAASTTLIYFVLRIVELVLSTLAIASILSYFGYLQSLSNLTELFALIEGMSSILNKNLIGEHCRTPIGFILSTITNILLRGFTGILSSKIATNTDEKA